jgi:hypothetical protein
MMKVVTIGLKNKISYRKNDSIKYRNYFTSHIMAEELKRIVRRTYQIYDHIRAIEYDAKFLKSVPTLPVGKLYWKSDDPEIVSSFNKFLELNDKIIDRLSAEKLTQYLAIAKSLGKLKMVDAEDMGVWDSDYFFFSYTGQPIVMHSR